MGRNPGQVTSITGHTEVTPSHTYTLGQLISINSLLCEFWDCRVKEKPVRKVTLHEKFEIESRSSADR